MADITIRDAASTSRVNLLVYGDPGVGKTTLVGSGGKQFKTLVIRPPVDHVDPIIGSGVKEVTPLPTTWTELDDILEYLQHEGHKWDWVWLDSISLWQDVGLDDIWETTILRKPSRAEFGMDKPEYGINMQRLSRWVRHVVGANLFNFGVTAHPFWMERPAEDFPDEEDDGMQMMPWVQGKQMAQKICAYMNVVAFMEVRRNPRTKKTYRVMHTDKAPRFYAKNQFPGAFGDDGRIINPTIPTIMESIDVVRRRHATRQPVRRRSQRG